ncbi:hypothetical protein [Streptomyces sp. NPDC096311]
MQVAEVKSLALQLPAETGTPLSRWSCLEPVREAVKERMDGVVDTALCR